MANTKITSRVIADNAVTSSAIADGAITEAKLASGVGGVAGIVSSADATAITIDSSENVGIGVSPSYKLHISGTSGSNILRVQDTGNNAGIGIGADATNGAEINYGGVDTLRFVNVSSERMRITSGGGVVVGNTSTSGTFSVYGGGGIELALNTTSTVATIQSYSSKPLALNALGNNVGIGTNNPNVKLDVNAGAENVAARFTSTDAGSYIQFMDNNATGHYIGTVGGSLAILNTSNVERMRIASDGGVSVSNDGQMGYSGSKFHVKGTAFTTSDSSGNAKGGFSTFSGNKDVSNSATTLFTINRDNGAHSGFIIITKSESGDSASAIYSWASNYNNTVDLDLLSSATAVYTGFTLSASMSNPTLTVQLTHGASNTKNYTYTVIYGGSRQSGVTVTLY